MSKEEKVICDCLRSVKGRLIISTSLPPGWKPPQVSKSDPDFFFWDLVKSDINW